MASDFGDQLPDEEKVSCFLSILAVFTQIVDPLWRIKPWGSNEGDREGGRDLEHGEMIGVGVSCQARPLHRHTLRAVSPPLAPPGDEAAWLWTAGAQLETLLWG